MNATNATNDPVIVSPQWQSQVGQDKWAWEQCGRKRNGTFLDIGCGHAKDSSNTWTLEDEFGWSGHRFDRGEVHGPYRRRSIFLRADARHIDWNSYIKFSSKGEDRHQVDFLSLDCDENTTGILTAIPLARLTFRCATIEHDRYRFGDGPRNVMRELLLKHGYVLAKADVSDQGLEFEDWWTCQELCE